MSHKSKSEEQVTRERMEIQTEIKEIVKLLKRAYIEGYVGSSTSDRRQTYILKGANRRMHSLHLSILIGRKGRRSRG